MSPRASTSLSPPNACAAQAWPCPSVAFAGSASAAPPPRGSLSSGAGRACRGQTRRVSTSQPNAGSGRGVGRHSRGSRQRSSADRASTRLTSSREPGRRSGGPRARARAGDGVQGPDRPVCAGHTRPGRGRAGLLSEGLPPVLIPQERCLVNSDNTACFPKSPNTNGVTRSPRHGRQASRRVGADSTCPLVHAAQTHPGDVSSAAPQASRGGASGDRSATSRGTAGVTAGAEGAVPVGPAGRGREL